MFQNVSTCFNIYQNISKYIKIYQHISTYLNIFKQCFSYLNIFKHDPGPIMYHGVPSRQQGRPCKEDEKFDLAKFIRMQRASIYSPMENQNSEPGYPWWCIPCQKIVHFHREAFFFMWCSMFLYVLFVLTAYLGSAPSIPIL